MEHDKTEITNQSLFYRVTGALIEKRYFVIFLLLVILSWGVLSYQRLPLEAFPDVANMQVRVITQVPGKAAEEVEKLVTIPIEKEVNGIPHGRPPRSISIFGLSVVTVVFDDDIEPNDARQQVLAKLANADVPEGIEPNIDENASAVGEIFRYKVEGADWSSADRKETQEWLLSRLFKSVDGIVDSTGFGGPTKIFLVELDPGRLRALDLSQSQVSDAIARSNDSTGGSYIVNNEQRFMVRGLGLIKNVEDLKNIVITTSDEGTPVLVKDVATVSISEAVRKGQVGINEDDDAVEGILMMRRGDNPSRAIGNLKEVWDDIQSQLPPGMKLVTIQDRTVLVNQTVETISHNVAEGVVLVVVILMLFLFQVRSALVCAIVIPTALLGASVILKCFNIPANILSLGAIDFGIIVDGAVVMIEHITKRVSAVEENTAGNVRNAICCAVNDVAKPILFATAIIAMTFLPILSFEHVEGRLFKPLAILMNIVLMIAALSTVTIVPVISYFVFRQRLPRKRESPIVLWMERRYERLLPLLSKHRKKALVAFVALFIGGFSLAPYLGTEFIPELEEGNIWLTVYVLPPSVTLEKSVEIARNIRNIFRSYPESADVLTQIGSPDDGTDPNPYNMIEVLVTLKPSGTWRNQFASKEKLIDALNDDINRQIPGLILNFSQCIKDSMEEAMSGVKNGEYAIKIFGTDLRVLENLGDEVSQAIGTVPGIVDVSHDNLMGQPQLAIEIDRTKSSRCGITTDQILDIVETSIGGKSVTKLIEGERRFDVVVRLKKEYREDSHKVGDILVAAPNGLKMPLRQLASIKEVEGANTILREKGKRRIAVYCNIRGSDLGSAVLGSQAAIRKEVKLPPGYGIEYAGEFERAVEAGKRLLVVVPITLVLIFCLLYLAFDSAGLSLLIMSAIPIAAVVATIVLFLTGTHLSISSGVGLVALFGLSTQNAVIIVSRFRDLKDRGTYQTIVECINRAALDKMNAVLIAALVAAVGLAPASMSTGIGSQSQKPFAIVISYGILPATLLTLVALPVLAPILLRSRKKDPEPEPELEPEPKEET